MDHIKSVTSWRKELGVVLQSKAEEFHLLGYDRATADEVWDCLLKKVWNGTPDKKLHQIVQDILHLQSHTYTSYLTSEAYQNDDLLDSIEALKGPSEY
ncbi:Post-transcriptional regulator [Halobacillus karajensis]|uniref:Post-transcriptional regulator ComN n=1 Tax=Halobacillus karajensis TaxID=195088 RepID=A0A024P721_9BACI|nr:post-transcriptional regulator [Halobacillus karajensis]CDQ18110.1 hypothetical protein BN982_00359 [Halobacillus karajensis]CDQ24461.1 hypothetical protein BN983_02744 [Halobacillus karajensis]CDQ29291.1 hypothetical protein BN981_03663 [Halobacillus karajensis]SEH59082.1 Post-transcriptional regulator [Halobacillus karajensis]